MSEKEKSALIHKQEVTEVEKESGAHNHGPECLEGEFEITVRKLEMPVKPRGVLAE